VLSKTIHFVGSVILMGSMWLLATVWLLSSLFSLTLEGWPLAVAALAFFALAVYLSWKLFVTRQPVRSRW
jgi:hypothetical protein